MPLLPTPPAVTRMRTEALRTLPDTVELWRSTFDNDTQVRTWARVDRCAARVIANQIRLPSERAVGERVTAVTSWQVRLPWDADPHPGDRIVRVRLTVSTMTDTEMQAQDAAGVTLEVTDADEIKSTPTSVIVNGYRVT